MRIGLTYTGSPEKHENYARWIRGEEEIEVIRLSAADDNLDQLSDCDGLVLSGGVDIHPSLYNGAPEYTKSPARGWEIERDLFEKAAFEKAQDKGLPVFGVCRGLQLINVCLGGSLVQDLGEKGDEQHEGVGGVDKRHAVRLEKDSLLYAIAGEDGGEINSAHHQSISTLGEGLRVNCYAGDGTIEGIEWADVSGRPFMLAVQWHPERMFTNGMTDRALYAAVRDRFIEEIRKIKGVK